MAERTRGIFGVYEHAAGVEAGVEALRAAGTKNEDISVLFAEPSKDLAHEKGSKAAEGAAWGAGAGGLIGGALGVLAGIGVLTAPGTDPLIAAGPITAGLAGMSVGGALGGVTGALIGMGVPEYEAKGYEGCIKEGGILLSVRAGAVEQAERAQEILKQTGARDISFTVEAESDSAKKDQPVPRAATTDEST
ncbi:MAG: DUF3341 domain-containing protein [Terriglobia bacterium]